MTTSVKDRARTDRRQFLGAAMAVAVGTLLGGKALTAQAAPSTIKAVAFDAFALFDVRPVFRLAEELFPGRGTVLSQQWRTRQFEYTWLRNSMRQYKDFWHVTKDALNYAAKQSKIELRPVQRTRLMSAYLNLKPWPDVASVMTTLQERGLRLAILSNMTSAMMQASVKFSGLEGVFEFHLSTDRVRAFKPEPLAYQMGTTAFRLQRRQVAFVAFGAWDAAGAKAFGYPTCWVNRLDVPPEELGVLPDATCHDLSALPGFIDSVLKT